MKYAKALFCNVVLSQVVFTCHAKCTKQITKSTMSDAESTIQLAGRELRFILKKSLRTRHLRIRLDRSKKLHISAPRLMSTSRIVEFLEEKENWIRKNLEKIETMNSEKAAARKQFCNGEVFSLRGEKYKLDIRLISKKRPHAYFECADKGQNVLVLEINKETPFKDIPEIGRKIVHQLYKKHAREHFLERLDEINQDHYRYRYGTVRIKSQKTLFGSCSSRKNLNFNWKVIMAPQEVIDYLLTHELCHLKEMNHSKSFWALVERACPDYKKHRKWLKSKGHTLTV